MQDFPHNYKRWRSKTILLHEQIPSQWPIKNKPNLVVGVTTINRWDYLEQFLESWLRTRNNSFNWTIIVADDGSTDGTIQRFMDFEIPNTKIVLLQNSGGRNCGSNQQYFQLRYAAKKQTRFNILGG